MAVRIQFRRGTAAEWTAANPTLAAGELGYEVDTTSFKLGDGTTAWNSLAYGAVGQQYVTDAIAAAVSDVVGLAPSTLDTLNEIAAALGDNPDFLAAIASDISASYANATSYADTAASNAVTTAHSYTDTTVNAAYTNATSYADNVSASTLSSAATYTNNAIASLVDTAPAALNTLNELAAALGDNPNFATSLATTLGKKLEFIIDTANNFITANALTVADTIYIESDRPSYARIGDGVHHYNEIDFIGMHYVDSEIVLHADTTTSVHGISNTLNLAYKSEVSTVANNLSSLTTTVQDLANTTVDALHTHDIDTSNVHGIANTLDLLTTSALGGASTTELGYLVGTTSNVQAQLNTLTNTLYVLDGTVADKLDSADAANIYAPKADPSFTGTVVLPANTSIGLTTAAELGYVHGLSSAVQTQLDDKLSIAAAGSTYAPINNPIFTGTVSGVTKGMVGLGNVDNTSDANKPVSTATQTALDLKAPIASPTFTGTVSGITKSMVGLGNVDNTTDASKPISTATQAALDLKANLAGATFSGNVTVTGNLTVSGTTTTVNTSNFTTADPLIYLGEGNVGNTADLGFVANFNDGTYQHTGLVRDSSAGTWKLFKGITDEPGTTVNFGQGSMDDLAVNNLTAAGVVFTDGTQTKAGVPSISAFTYKTASYTLDALSLRDGIIEVSSASATTITIPLDSAVNYPIGSSIDIMQTNTGQVTIAGANGVTVNATPGLKLRTQWSSATLLKRAANTWVVYGDLMA